MINIILHTLRFCKLEVISTLSGPCISIYKVAWQKSMTLIPYITVFNHIEMFSAAKAAQEAQMSVRSSVRSSVRPSGYFHFDSL